MKLYHVSYDPIWFFNPRVPKSRLPMEDAETPRICLSDRIERCVNAKPCQAQALCLAKEYGLRVPLYVYEFDTDAIPPDLLVGPDELVGQYGVIDAKLNHEYWLLSGDVPYQEIYYEVIGGVFLPPDEGVGDDFPSALSLRLVEEESSEAAWLAWAVCELNKPSKDGKYITSDCVIANCVEDIIDLLKSHT